MELNQGFNHLKTNLSEDDIDKIVILIGYRCRIKTCNRLRSVLTYSPSFIKYYGILDRLYKHDNGEWRYCAGQSYPDEIRTVRELILGK